MSDSRFYALLIVVIAVAGLGTIVTLDYLQPEKVNVELVEKIVAMLAPVLAILSSRLGASKEAATIQRAAAEAAEKADVAKRVAVASHQDLIVNSRMTEEIRDKVVP
jgi:hypothetical protein